MQDLRVYAGTKVINAAPMTRADYNIFRGWQLPADECGEDEGYLVEYVDQGAGTQPNTSQFSGYVSWSPKAVFERAYAPIHSMTFGIALEMCKQGYRIARKGWNAGGQYVQLVSPSAPHVNNFPEESQKEKLEKHPGLYNSLFIVSDNNPYAPGTLLPWLGLKTAQNGFVPWLASQTDMLADDWVVVRG